LQADRPVMHVSCKAITTTSPVHRGGSACTSMIGPAASSTPRWPRSSLAVRAALPGAISRLPSAPSMLSGVPASSCLTCPAAGPFARTPISLCMPGHRSRRPPWRRAAYPVSTSQARRLSPTAPATDARARMERSRCRWLGGGAAGAVARCRIDDRLPGTVPGGSFRRWACVSAVAVLKGGR
jgi:hypothetical protein